MANVTYTLYGETYLKSQAQMMIHVFDTVLRRHSDFIELALLQMKCLSSVDYSQDYEALRNAAASFRTRKTLQIEGNTICVATSYNMKQKIQLITQLFTICHEEYQELVIDGWMFPAGRKYDVQKTVSNTSLKKGIRYELFGKVYESNQTAMMYRVFEEVFKRVPTVIDWAIENLTCVSAVDYSIPENRMDMPPYFRSCHMLSVEGKSVCIGSSYGSGDKIRLIDKLLHGAGLPKTVFKTIVEEVEPFPFDLRKWQFEAVEKTMQAFTKPREAFNSLGIVSMPVGTGKSVFVTALIHRFIMQNPDWAVLILTSRSGISEQYYDRLKSAVGGYLRVTLAVSKRDLAYTVGVPGSVVISTAQKLLNTPGKNTLLDNDNSEKAAPIIYEDSNLLVIVEEVAYEYYGRLYENMHKRFPQATFLGLSNYLDNARRVTDYFGPYLYIYSYEDAFIDYALEPFSIICYENMTANEKLEMVLNSFISSDEEALIAVICPDIQTMADYYFRISNAIKGEYVFIYKTGNTSSSKYQELKYGFPPESFWDGKKCHGILLTCTIITGMNTNIDVFFVDKKLNSISLQRVMGAVARKRKSSRMGRIIDFCNGTSKLERCLPESCPIKIETFSTEKNNDSPGLNPNILIEQLCDKLVQCDYLMARDIILQLQKEFHSIGNELSEQLSFLFNLKRSIEEEQEFWERNRQVLTWRAGLWNALSKDSKQNWTNSYPEDETEAELVSELESEDAEYDLPIAADIVGIPQERGARLELAVYKLLREFFLLDEETSNEVLTSLRRQISGPQFGFDISFSFQNEEGTTITCRIECKNYAPDNPISKSHVSDKLSDLQLEGIPIDHWILISPNSQPDNRLNSAMEVWGKPNFWNPIRDVQLWTPNNGVSEFFGIIPELYDVFYEHSAGDHPKNWTQEYRQKIIRKWKKKFAPVVFLPETWQQYIQNPDCLMTPSDSKQDLKSGYERRMPMRLLDESGNPIAGTAEDYITQWLHKPQSTHLLLLGEFGDGKTFFTYVLSRHLINEFQESPKACWIPLRLSLRELQNGNINTREFLAGRLKEFGSTLAEWNSLQERYNFLIILDGLDEMSQNMNYTALLRNINRVEQIVHQFQGHKILITSRKIAYDIPRVRQELIDCLQNPEILQMAPLMLGDRLRYFKALADTPKKKERLRLIQETNDLIGLASKPLFLEMECSLLENGDICEMDGASLYEHYAMDVLNRKIEISLLRDGNTLTRAELIKNVLGFLGRLALCLQCQGLNSINLDAFTQLAPEQNYAKWLWEDESVDTDVNEDARERLSNRSLLKYDYGDPIRLGFCHRSMKEYFVAYGLVELLDKSPDKARKVLSECNLGYEIIDFIGKKLKRLENQSLDKIIARLVDFAHEACGFMYQDSQENDCQGLGANSVSILNNCIGTLPGTDWSHLVLDNAFLSDADLSHKDFSGTSFRNAHLDNVDLTCTNLSNCDFTNVRLEESGSVSSIALSERESALFAYYADGNLRRWSLLSGQVQDTYHISEERSAKLFLLEEGREALADAEKLQFLTRTHEGIRPIGRAPYDDRAYLLDVGPEAVVSWKNGRLGIVDLLNNTQQVIENVPEGVRAVLITKQLLTVYYTDKKLAVFDLTNNCDAYVVSDKEHEVTAMRGCYISDNHFSLLLGHRDGSLHLYQLTRNGETNNWNYNVITNTELVGDYIVDVGFYQEDYFFCCTLKGNIVEFHRRSDGSLGIRKNYQLRIQCKHAILEGIFPISQYNILKKASEEV